ncbi:MAG: hypothetical protein WBD34_20190 [Burkholderiaceae bacterium]
MNTRTINDTDDNTLESVNTARLMTHGRRLRSEAIRELLRAGFAFFRNSNRAKEDEMSSAARCA